MTDNTQKAQGSGAVELIERLRDVYGALTPGAIDRADLDGMAFAVQDAISFLSQPPEASEPKPWYETDAHRDLSRIIPDMEGKIAEAKIRFGHCLPANLFAPIEASITELQVLRHELAAFPAPEASEVEAVAWRPEVRAFANLMERQLRANDHKPGWKGDHWVDLFNRIEQERLELGVECSVNSRGLRTGTPETIGREAADVANFAMMVADVCGALPLYAHPPKASPMQELQAMGQEFDAGVEASALRVTGEMLKAALLEEGGDAYMRNEDTPSHFLIDGIVDLDAVANALAQPAPGQPTEIETLKSAVMAIAQSAAERGQIELAGLLHAAVNPPAPEQGEGN